MWAAVKGFFSSLLGSASTAGGQSVISEALNIASEKVLDVDKLCGLIKDVVIAQLQADSNPSWVNALQNIKDAPQNVQQAVAWYIRGDTFHKLMRSILWLSVVIAYVSVSIVNKQPMDISTLMMLAAGPGLYTLMKGAGRK